MKISQFLIRATVRAHQPDELFPLIVFGFGTEARLADRASHASWRETVAPVSLALGQRIRSGCGNMLFIVSATS
jgi:hypothetical protein